VQSVYLIDGGIYAESSCFDAPPRTTQRITYVESGRSLLTPSLCVLKSLTAHSLSSSFPDMASVAVKDKGSHQTQSRHIDVESSHSQGPDRPQDVFGDERNHDIQYKTLSWQVSWQPFLRSLVHTSTFLPHCTCTACELVDDSRDRQQWNAIFAQRNGRRRSVRSLLSRALLPRSTLI
jgi:hypothetical protein